MESTSYSSESLAGSTGDVFVVDFFFFDEAFPFGDGAPFGVESLAGSTFGMAWVRKGVGFVFGVDFFFDVAFPFGDGAAFGFAREPVSTACFFFGNSFSLLPTFPVDQ